MVSIEIREPIWKDYSIGIATYKVVDDLLIDITYMNHNGSKQFPCRYFISKERARKYPTMTLKKGIKLYHIPIADLEVYKNG